jgi:ribose-phosphate pyrophosphokinase
MLDLNICKLQNKATSLNNTVFLIGNGNRPFGLKVASTFNHIYQCTVSECQPSRFANGEIRMDSIKENIRQKDIIIIQSMIETNINNYIYSVNDLFIELCTMIDAVIRGSAKSVTVVMPIFPYQRQDRKDCSRCPITARMITTILESLKISRVIVFDLHASQIQGFFSNTPLDNLFSEPYFIKYIKELNKTINPENPDNFDKICLVSPDEGGIKRVIRMTNKMNIASAFIYKERKKANEISNMIIMGDVQDKICILVDDMIDTGGTACKACQLLKDNGATEVYMCACHGLLSHPCIQRIKDSGFKKVVVTNTVINDTNIENNDKIDIIDVTEMCAIAIERCLNGESLSELINIEV